MRRLLTTLMALFSLVLGITHAGAMAAAPHAVPAVAMVDAAEADMPCHGASADAADAANDSNHDAASGAGCCPDGCNAGCMMLAALASPAVGPMPIAEDEELPRPTAAPAPDSRGDGLKRPPRPTA